MALVGFAHLHQLDSFNILRLWKLVKYVSQWEKMESLRESIDLLRRSSVVILSILGVMVIIILFISTVVNTLLVAASDQNEHAVSSRCRLLTAEGKYKIDESVLQLCGVNGLSCPAGTVCLANDSPLLHERGRPG